MAQIFLCPLPPARAPDAIDIARLVDTRRVRELLTAIQTRIATATEEIGFDEENRERVRKKLLRFGIGGEGEFDYPVQLV